MEGISRELLPTMELVIEHGDASYLVVVEVADEGHERRQGLMCRETVRMEAVCCSCLKLRGLEFLDVQHLCAVGYRLSRRHRVV